MCTKYSLLQKIDLGQDTIRTIHRTGTLWNIPEAGLFPMGHRVRYNTTQLIVTQASPRIMFRFGPRSHPSRLTWFSSLLTFDLIQLIGPERLIRANQSLSTGRPILSLIGGKHYAG